MRAPTTQNATRTSAASGGWVSYSCIGRLVVVSYSLNITTLARKTVLATGLPLGTGNAFSAAVGENNRCAILYVDSTTGKLTLDQVLTASGWFNGMAVYVSAS